MLAETIDNNDTGLANTGLANTGLADTGLANTGLANTGLANTGLADTGLADTGLADTTTDKPVVKRAVVRRKKTAPTENLILVIPTSDNYNAFLSHKFNSIQLKSICKHYKLPVSGNKQILTNTIYKYLYFSYYATRIQRQWRKTYVKIYAKLRGPARFNRQLCVNETDFFTMDLIKEIPFKQFFSYRDSKDNMIYGFDIMSLYNLIEKNENENENERANAVLNPYTRTPLSRDVLRKFSSLLYFADLLKEDLQLDINENETDTKIAAETVQYTIEQRVFNLFHDIDILGNYTNPLWFMDLRRHQILLYIKDFYDIWTYRAQLADVIKHEICPQGNPFAAIQLAELAVMPFRELQHTVLVLMETMVRGGVNHNSRYLGATYVLCALTLVNTMAAEALPWLYESVHF